METIIQTWSEAVEAWSRQPQNKIHWPKMKVSFEKIFSCLDRKLTCKECTMEVLASAMAEIIAERDDQKRCSAFMLQSLNYAAATYPEDNPMPKFTSFELVNRANEIQQERWMPDVKPSEEKTEHSALPEQTETPPAPEPEPEKPKDNAETKPSRNTKARKVVKLDPTTFQPICEYNSISAAQKATGAKNVDRAISKRSKAAGWYWCIKGDEADFKAQATFVHGHKTGKKTKKEDPREHQAPVIPPEPFLLSDDDLIEELRRRGFTGELNITKTYKL